MDRQDLALVLSIAAIASSLGARWRRPDEDPLGEPPLPDWARPYLAAFDRFLRGDADAPFAMREIARQNIPDAARRASLR